MRSQWIYGQIQQINDGTLDKLQSYSKRLEQKVGERTRKSQWNTEAILGEIGYSIIVLDKELNIIWTNEIALKKFKSVPGKKCYQVIKSLNQPCAGCIAKKTLADGIVRSLEEDIVAENGENTTFIATCSLVSEPNRENNSIVLMMHDITERKKAEKELKESEQSYRNLVGRANDGIAILQDGVLKYINSHAAEIVGYVPEELINTQFTDHVHPDELNKVVNRYERRMAGEDLATVYETVIKHKDGSYVDVEFNSGIFKYSGKNANFVLIRDITEQKRAEKELRTAHQQLLDIIEFLPYATFVIDAEKKVIAWNRAIEEMTGIQKEDILGKGDYVYSIPFYGKRRPILIDLVFDYVNVTEEDYDYSDVKKKYLSLEVFAPSVYGGKGAYMSVRASPLFDASGKEIGAIESIRDITERRKVEETLKASERKYSALVEKGNDGIIFIQDGLLKFANEKMVKMTGFSLEEAVGRPFLEFVSPEFRGLAQEIYEQSFNSNGESSSSYVLAVLSKDGKNIPVEVSPSIIEYEDKNAFMAIIRNITERKHAEEELRTAHQKLFDIIEFLPDATFVIDAEKKVIAWNRAIEEMTGVKKEEVFGKGDYAYAVPFYGERRPIIVDLMSDPDIDFEQKYNFVENRGNSLFSEVFVPTVYGGKGAYLWIIASHLFDSSGKRIGAIESIRDITDHKRVEDALREQKDFAASLVLYSTVPTFVIDSQHKIVHWNKASEELTGIKASEIVGTDRFYVSKNPSFADIVISRELGEQFDRSKKYRRSKYLSNGLHAENWVSNLGGMRRYVLFDAAPIYNCKGELVCALETMQEITEQKQTEQMIKHRLEVETAISSVSSLFVAPNDIDDAISVALDEIGRLCRASRSYVFLFRENETIMDNTHEWCNEGVEPQKEKLQNLPTDIYPWWMARLENGEIIHIPDVSSLPPEASAEKDILEMQNIMSLLVLPIYSKGELMGYIGLDNVVNTGDWSEDIINVLHMVSNVVGIAIERKQTEDNLKKYAEKLQHSNELKDLFTDILHHDLLNPAGVVGVHTEILLDTEEDEQKRKSLFAIERNTEKLVNLIQRASKFAKLESVEKLDLEPMDIGDIIKEVIESFMPRLEKKQMSVEFTTDEAYLAHVNPVIEEVFANLLSNAIKYSPENSRIIIDIMDAGEDWKVSVTDSGEGIADEDKVMFFERFKRADRRDIKGTGLGLAIVKRLIAMHGGSVGVEDNPAGQGSMFWVTVGKA
ncbi:MAG: PAS domain S-box protein [Methanosarcinaceae archaeon]|nr:PAS domain S-box protein [Methanosarcinaceae archaeon]